jgi:hypothetical protein
MGNCLDIFLGQIDIPNQIDIKYQIFRSDTYQVMIHYSNGKIENKLLTHYRHLLSDYWLEKLEFQQKNPF